MHDTITSRQWHKFRDEELEKMREEKGIPEKDIRRDVHVLMPPLDLFAKTK